jgi:hypothetical protein
LDRRSVDVGREMSMHALDYYTQLKTVWVDMAE